MAPLYKPPTAVVTSQTPFLALVTQADPSWQRGKFYEVEYQFSNRAVMFDPYIAGAYGRRTNTYPVGAQYGGPDPNIVDNLAPTVGNEVPGLYEGVPDGKGWA